MPDLDLAKYIDHTLLKPEATSAAYERLCLEAVMHRFFSVCLPPVYVSFAKRRLENSSVQVCTVVGFPHGLNLGATKAFETARAVASGADEVDMVLNISALKSGERTLVSDDISAVVLAAEGRTVKVILETCLLTDDQKVLACQIAESSGAQFVKTSTGFSTGGATVSDVELLRKSVGPQMQVKASGGIRDRQTALAMIEAGASRLGTSSGIVIVSSL